MLSPIEIPPNTYQVSKLYLQEAAHEAMELSLTLQEKFSRGDSTIAWIYQYFGLNILLAKPAGSWVCSRERIETLYNAGMSDKEILVNLVAPQFALDHFIPTAMMLAADVEYTQHANLPDWLAPFAGFLTARLIWGITNGLFQAAVFSYLKNHNQSFDEDVVVEEGVCEEASFKFAGATF